MRKNYSLYKNQGIHVINSIFTIKDGKVKVLLIKRKNDPYKDMWALVGGAVYNNERLEDACLRETKEKTGIENVELHQFGVYDEINLLEGEYLIQVMYVPCYCDLWIESDFHFSRKSKPLENS